MQLLCLTLFFRDFLGSRVFDPAKQIWIKENQKCFNEKNLKAILNGFNIYLFIYLFNCFKSMLYKYTVMRMVLFVASVD